MINVKDIISFDNEWRSIKYCSLGILTNDYSQTIIALLLHNRIQLYP